MPRSACRATAIPTLLFFAALLPLLFAGCGGQEPPDELSASASVVMTSGTAVYAAYVLLTEAPDGTPQPIARVIVDGTSTCPALYDGADGTVPTIPRDNPHGFEVLVCEALIPFDQSYTVTGWANPLPAASKSPTHPVIIGDTGCKSKDCAAGTPAAPFQAIASQAALKGPDLVLHAGDFNYRGTGGYDYQGNSDDPEYDAGDVDPDDPQCQLEDLYVSQNAGYSDQPDSWDDWYLDFFEAAADLLAQAPFVVTRGNHELCSRAGPGWFYFLDPSSNLNGTQLSCPDQGGETPPQGAEGHIILRSPQTIELDTLRIVSIDAANACDAFAPDFTTNQYTQQFVDILSAVPDAGTGATAGPPTWILGHRPTWAADSDDSAVAQTLSTAFEQALDQLGLDAPPDGLTLMVAGHMHQFQSDTFAGDRPPQLVVGNSGVKSSGPYPSSNFQQEVDGLEATGIASTEHGFLDVTSFDAQTGAWQGTLFATDGSTVIATCDSSAPGGSICAF